MFTTYTRLTQAYAYSGDQSWTEISNTNFIIIVPSSTRIQLSPVAVLRLRQQVVVARTERAFRTEDDVYHRRRVVGLPSP